MPCCTVSHNCSVRSRGSISIRIACRRNCVRSSPVFRCVFRAEISFTASSHVPRRSGLRCTRRRGCWRGTLRGSGRRRRRRPRGMLWHRYSMNQGGEITAARIVPPTSQNQARIEADLRESLTHFGLDRPEEAMRLRAEMVIRNYDPCISCATHFLRLAIHHDASHAVPHAETAPWRVVVLGVGTEQQGDEMGLRVIDGLRDEAELAPYVASGRLSLCATRQPRLDWPHRVRDGDEVFVIDALREAPGEGGLRIVDGAALAGADRPLSSHALGVGAAREVFDGLGPRAAAITVIGIAVGAAGEAVPAPERWPARLREIRARLLARLSRAAT